MTTLDLVVSTPMPAGTVLTLDALDGEGNPLALQRIEPDEAASRATFEEVDDIHPVLSLVIEPGGGAHTSRPFFRPGARYVQSDPYAAPEILGVFRCAGTARFPDTGALAAYGFGNTRLGMVTGKPWVPVFLSEAEWAEGWTRLPDDSAGTAAP